MSDAPWLALGRPLSLHEDHTSGSVPDVDGTQISSSSTYRASPTYGNTSDPTPSEAGFESGNLASSYPIQAGPSSLSTDGYHNGVAQPHNQLLIMYPNPGSSTSSPNDLMKHQAPAILPVAQNNIDNQDPEAAQPSVERSASSPAQSSDTIQNPSETSHNREKGRSEEVGEPSEKNFCKAGALAAAGAGAGVAGKAMLAKGVNKEPKGWQDMEVEEKHHIHHHQIRDSRRAAIKVSTFPLHL